MLITRARPYEGLREPQVFKAILSRKFLEFPDELMKDPGHYSSLIGICEDIWSSELRDRPAMRKVTNEIVSLCKMPRIE